MIFRIIFRNLVYKPLGTVLSILLLMFGVGIISMLLTLYRQAEDKFNNDLKDIDLVVGAKGSPLQLVLSAVYHIDAPTGNILQSDAEKVIHNPMIKQSIPLAYGDSYKTYPIIGTDSAFFALYAGELQQGNLFAKTLESVVGANAATITGLKVGDTFLGTHGLGAKGHVHKEFQYKVVGILKPSNTVMDNLVLTNIQTVWEIHSHHHQGKGDKDDDDDGEHEHEQRHDKESASGDTVKPENELTALLIKFRSPMGLMMIPRVINETTNMQAASPVLEINRLFDLLGVGVQTVQAVAFAIMLISGLSVFISLYSRLQERKYELALARSMGSSRLRLFAMVLAEGITLAVAGFAAGILLSRIGLLLLDKFAVGKLHIDLRKQGLSGQEGWLFLVTLGIGLAAALIPAIKALRLNISKTLAND